MPVAAARPRTEAQRLASRLNGARSRGPVTAEGRARSSRNAFRHGLCATADILAPGEDPLAFETLLAELRAEHRPVGAGEDLLVHRLAVTFWKLARCDRLEAQLAGTRPRTPAGRIYPEPGVPALLSRPAELHGLLRHQAQLGRELGRLLKALAARPEPARPAEPEQAEAEPPPAVAAHRVESRNEPEPAPSPPAEPAPLPAAEPVAAEPPVDPERRLRARAARAPGLALGLLEHLLEEGELARFVAVAERLDPAGAKSTAIDGPPRLG